MSRPRLLDLFCGAGGAAVGYHRAGFDVTGVDIKPQPRYPFPFIHGDALEYVKAHGHEYDAIHASPPCQDHTRQFVPRKHGTGWMLDESRRLLLDSGKMFILENVPGAPMQPNLIICGCVVGLLDIERERWFETSPPVFCLRQQCHHTKPVISISGNGTPTWTYRAYGSISLDRARRAMGIDWMTRKELSQAIPPAYTEWIGTQLLRHIGSRP